MINLWDANARAIIAFSLAMITLLLTYIAFFKEDVEKHLHDKSVKKTPRNELN